MALPVVGQDVADGGILLFAGEQDAIGAVLVVGLRFPPEATTSPPGEEPPFVSALELFHGDLPVNKGVRVCEEPVGLPHDSMWVTGAVVKLPEDLAARSSDGILRDFDASPRRLSQGRDNDSQIRIEEPVPEPGVQGVYTRNDFSIGMSGCGVACQRRERRPSQTRGVNSLSAPVKRDVVQRNVGHPLVHDVLTQHRPDQPCQIRDHERRPGHVRIV